MWSRWLLVGILLLVLSVASEDSVHPEENNHLYDPLDPNTVLQCPNTTIEGTVGDRVILSCSTEDKMDISVEEVEWTFKDPTTGEDKNVHTYFQGEDFLHQQSDDFKGRTSLFKDQLSSGNCSLSLLVTTSHSGSYQSCVGGRLCCTVTLKGTDRQKIIGDVVGVLGVGVLIIIITLACYYHERLMNCCSQRRNANNPQSHQSASYHQAQQTPENQES